MIWRLLDSTFARFYTWMTANVGYFRWLDWINAKLHRLSYYSTHESPKTRRNWRF
jgi:hypothetical protein